MSERGVHLYGGLFLGVVAVSWAAIFIRLAGAPALSTSAYRMLFAAAPVAVLALARRRGELVRLSRGDIVLLTLSGVALGLHFATWIASLSRTTVASSVALVTTQPLWVALLAFTVLSERISRRGLLAILIATAGGITISGADVSVSGEALVGDLLAVAGAIFGAVYFVAGRSVRRVMSLATYVGVVYSLAAVLLLIATVSAGQPLSGFSGKTWTMLALMALAPQLLGHTLLNWALRYLSAPAVSIAVLGEPVISTALAVPILGERPGLVRVVGGAIILAGVYLALRDEAAHSASHAVSAPATVP